MRSHWYNEDIKIVYPNPYEEQVIDEFNRNAKEDYKYVLGALLSHGEVTRSRRKSLFLA